ncbi:MAG: deoxyribonuclease IV [Tannerella sp.]|jgi:deoxyribonuclease-4|nr:deoxyribonuclease IV [Tannerella sp.]
MFRIGCHLSISGGYTAMLKDAMSIGANTFQFFTRNPRGGQAKAIDEADIASFLALAEDNDVSLFLAHAPYTMNICAADAAIRRFARDTFADDLRRMEYLPGSMYNFHPGSHVGQGIDAGIEMIVAALNDTLLPSHSTTVLLETMAGKGSEVGGKFEELKRIIDGVKLSDKIGVCLDTCHIYDAGYDIVNDLDKVLDEFDNIVGLSRLHAIHLNDSKNPYGSHKDRHETIGNGSLGIETLTRIINHPRLRNLPFYLETPNELPGYKAEIALLKEWRT